MSKTQRTAIFILFISLSLQIQLITMENYWLQGLYIFMSGIAVIIGAFGLIWSNDDE